MEFITIVHMQFVKPEPATLHGFKIHQGCTIGHKKNGGGNGNAIGNNVTMYCNSSIIGELNIGDNVIIGAHVLVTKDCDANKIIVSTNSVSEKELR